MAESEQQEEPLPPSTSSAPSAPSRPTITLPPRTSFETLFNTSGGGATGQGLGFSPGPMTLVSSFFSDGEDCKSFSQLLAGAMLSPAGFPQLEDRNSGDDSSEFRFKQNEPAGQSIGPPSPMFPAGFLDSPGLFSPGQVHTLFVFIKFDTFEKVSFFV